MRISAIRPHAGPRRCSVRAGAYLETKGTGTSAPPTPTAANQLEALKQMSKVVAGELGSEKLELACKLAVDGIPSADSSEREDYLGSTLAIFLLATV